MAPIELVVRIGSTDKFPVEIDDEETVETLGVMVVSLKDGLGDEPRMVYKGKVLKDEDVLRSLGMQSGDFVVVVPPKGSAGAVLPVSPAAPAEQHTATSTPVPPAPAAPQPVVPAAVPAQTPAIAGPPEALVEQLCAMGFERPQVVKALQAAFNNPDRAVEYLFNGIPAASEQASQPGPQEMGGQAQMQFPEGVLGPQLLTKSGVQPIRQALGAAKVVALYFSAHWCPPCRQFTPMLAAAFASAPSELAVIFISSDRDEASFQQYYAEMPWLALPFAAMQRQALGAAFGVRGIPSLVILDATSGKPISTDGRGDVQRNGFNLTACLQQWGVAQTTPPAPAAPAVPAVTEAPAPPKKVGPEPIPIDDVAADAALERVQAEPWEVQEVFYNTGLKVLDNLIQNPDEPKFRQLKRSNAALTTKLFAVGGDAGIVLLDLAGFQPSADGQLLVLDGPLDGRCTAVRNKIQATGTAAWERHAREQRDAKIKEEMEKDKDRPSRYSGGGDGSGRMDIGRGRRGGGGG